MRDLFMKFRKSEDGATLVEYGLALLVAIGVGGTALTLLAAETAGNFSGAHNSAAFDVTDGTLAGTTATVPQ